MNTPTEQSIAMLHSALLTQKAKVAVEYEKLTKLNEKIIVKFGKDITEAVGKKEGSKTHTIGDYKVELKAVLNRKFDREVDLQEILDQLPKDRIPLKYDPKIDDMGVKWMEKNDPENFRIFSKAIITTPGKPSVNITYKPKGK